jgi:hypothetical protein
MSRTRNSLVRAIVTTDKPCESGNRLMSDLRIVIRDQNVGKISYNAADANILMTASFACETMECALADRRNGIAQSTAEDIRRKIAGVVIQKEQAEPAHRRIRIAKCSRLYCGGRNLLPYTRLSFLRQRRPSVNKIMREFKVRSPHPLNPI